MLKFRRLLPALLALALLGACAGPLPDAPSPTPAAAAPGAAPATAVPLPTEPPAQTETPTGLPASTATPPLPSALIDAQSAARLAPLRGLGLGKAYGAAFTPDGSALVAGTEAGLVWYALPGLEQYRFDPVGPVFSLAISPVGDRLAHSVYRADSAPRSAIRRAADASLVAEVEGGFPSFSPDGELLVTGAGTFEEARPARVWSAADGAAVAELAGLEPRFSPGGAYIVTVETNYGEPSLTRLYPALGGTPVLEVEATTPAFSPDDVSLAVTSGEQIEVYSLPGGELLVSIPTPVAPAAAFSADGQRLLIVVGSDLWVWDLATNREIARLAGVNRADEFFPPEGPRLTADGGALATFEPQLGDCPPGGVTVNAIADGRTLYKDDLSYSAVFAPDSERIATLTGNGLRVADLSSGAAVDLDLQGYQAIALSPSGATLAASTTGVNAEGRLLARVELWDLAASVKRGELLSNIDDFAFSVTRLAFSADGARVSALVGYGCAAFGFWKVVAWDVASGQIVSEIVDLPTQADAEGNLTDQPPAVFAIAPGGAAAAWLDAEQWLVLRRAGGEDERFPTEALPTALAFTPDGRTLLIGDEVGRIASMSLDGGASAQGSASGAVRELALSPDGALVVALFEGGGGSVLRVADLAEIASLAVPAEATGASIATDGAVVAVSEAGGVGLYDGTGGARIGQTASGGVGLIGPGRRLLATVEHGRVLLWGAP